MKPKNVIVWILLLGIVVLLMSTSVQAKELTEVNANDILEKIENGEDIYRENVHIVGELDLSEIKLKTIPNTRTELKILSYDIEEELKIVESKIEIHDSVFEDDVNFSNTQFRKDIDFSGTSFLGKINFIGASFTGYADFHDVDFTGYAYFHDVDFTGYADFHDVDFTGYAYFWSAVFGDDANFLGADFGDDANFGSAVFTGYADFMSAVFTGYVNFMSADFGDDANFLGADFGDDAYFWGAVFGDDADFRGARFNPIYISWNSLKYPLVFDGPTYVKLIKNFREIEQFEDADAAYYQYRRLSQANKKWSYSKLMDIVAGASCGYGVKPERPLIWAFGLIMVFTLVYWLGKGIKRLKVNNGDNNRVSRWAAFYNSFYFSVVTFTTVGYGDWYPEDRYRIVVMIEGVLGWLLLALFIVTLANVMIRP